MTGDAGEVASFFGLPGLDLNSLGTRRLRGRKLELEPECGCCLKSCFEESNGGIEACLRPLRDA